MCPCLPTLPGDGPLFQSFLHRFAYNRAKIQSLLATLFKLSRLIFFRFSFSFRFDGRGCPSNTMIGLMSKDCSIAIRPIQKSMCLLKQLHPPIPMRIRRHRKKKRPGPARQFRSVIIPGRGDILTQFAAASVGCSMKPAERIHGHAFPRVLGNMGISGASLEGIQEPLDTHSNSSYLRPKPSSPAPEYGTRE